jgi:hypothetical protein
MEQRIHDCHDDDGGGAEASRTSTPSRGIGGAAHVLSSSPLELFLLSQEVLPAESVVPAAGPAEWFEVATLDAEAKDEDASRKDERGGDDDGDADCGNFVADHLLSLIRGSVGGSAALGRVWRAPGQGSSAADDDDESGEEGCDDEGDGTYDFGPPAPQPLAALDPRSAAWHAAAARERGKRRARHEVAARAAARATAEEQRKRAARRAAEAARRKALLGAHQVVDQTFKKRGCASMSVGLSRQLKPFFLKLVFYNLARRGRPGGARSRSAGADPAKRPRGRREASRGRDRGRSGRRGREGSGSAG